MAKQKFSWGGKQSSQQPQHRWQASGPQKVSLGGSRRAWEWRLLVALFGLLVLALVWLLLVWEKRTPVITMAVTQYERPVPPNGWAEEDSQGLVDLSARDGNLDVYDLSASVKLASDVTTVWLDALSKHSRPQRSLFWKEPLPLIIYVNMHGVVDDSGSPCLLPPGTSPLDNDGLIRVDTVLDQIADQIPKERNKLLLLDCHRVLVEWNMGILYNTFADRLAEVVEQRQIPNLAVLTAASAGQRSWDSANLHGSAFGRYLQLGLAGAADGAGPGQQDGDVSLHELTSYLQTEVGNWTAHNRAERQEPSLLPVAAPDFRLTNVVASKLKTLEAIGPGSSASPVDVAEIWNKLDGLRSQAPLRYDPIGWREFEHRLLWLERLAESGGAYRDTARREFDELKNRLDAIGRAVSDRPTGSAVASHSSIFTGRKTSWDRLKLHSLPLAEYFGFTEAASGAKPLLERLADTTRTAEQVLAEFEEAVADKPTSPATPFAVTHFLLSARRQRVSELWNRPALASELYQLRQRADLLAIPRDAEGRPTDERAHFYVCQALQIANAARRELEDAVFVGPQASVDLDQLLSRTKKLYDGAEQVRRQADAAFEVSDRVWYEAPYLAAWLTRTLGCETEAGELASAEQERGRSVETLLEIIQTNQQLAERMARPEPLNADLEFSFAGQTASLTELLEKVRRPFDEKVKELTVEQNPRTLRTVAAVLALPLIPAERRVELLEIKRRVSALLNQEYVGEGGEAALIASADAVSEGATSEEMDLLDRFDIWERHPLAAILQIDEDGSLAQIPRIEQGGRLVRAKLADLEDLEELPDHQELVQYRQTLSLLEDHIRAAASLWFSPSRAATAIGQLREFELQQLLLWHAAEAIEDFWDSELEEYEQPYFAIAADDYLRGPDVFVELPTVIGAQIEQYRSLLESRKAARDDLHLMLTKSDPIPNVPDSGRMEIVAEQESAATNFPVGAAALYVLGKQAEASPLRVTNVDDVVVRPFVGAAETPDTDGAAAASGRLALPLEGDRKQRFLILARHASNLGPSPRAIAYFRGHEFPADLEVRPLSGVEIAFEPYRYGPPRITLNGDRQERSAFMFVLDCSASMNDLLEVEGAKDGDNDNANGAGGNDPDARKLPKLDLARGHLTSMMEELAERNFMAGFDETHVGVRLFGHRIGWTEDGKIIRMRKELDALGRIPANLKPAEDVESLRPVARFDAADVHLIRRQIEPVIAWGQSPLYLSLVQSLAEFPRVSDDMRKEIVAITDGANFQYISPQDRDSRVTRTYKADLLAKWRQLQQRGVNVRINFLDFGGEDANEFREVARATGGTYEHVESGRDLLRLLRERLDLDGYTVDDWQDETLNEEVDGGAQKLNTTLEMTEEQFRANETYQVNFRAVSKPVYLEGGEAVELQLQGSEIGAIPYDKSVAAFGQLVRGQGGVDANHLFRVHTPIRDGDGVNFKVSLQQDPRLSHFTRRPKETWLEVTPFLEDSKPQSYLFYDTNFEPDQPVPVLVWKASHWPRQAESAQVSFWCKDRITPSSKILLSAVRNAPARYGQYQPAPDADGISLLIRVESAGQTYEINVIEKHDSTSPGVDTLRIQFQTDPAVRPNRVFHQFDNQTGYATHRFEFAQRDRARIESSELSAILVAPKTAVHDGAWQLKQRLLVRVYNEGDLLPLDAAAGPGGGTTQPPE